MADIQKYFLEFHDNIKLGVFDENAKLRDKRDKVIKKIKTGIENYFKEKDMAIPSLDFFDQGSYKIGTGINPENNDYDIDEGVIFDLKKEDYDDPVEFKIIIRDIMLDYTSIPPQIKHPCVTITYSENKEPAYHVDLPVYLKSTFGELFLARGKEFSKKENKYWEEADPKGLNDYIINKFKDEDRTQFRRVVRYLKKWKDICFSTSGNQAPPSIGLTLDAAELFSPYKTYNYITSKSEYVDLYALKAFVNALKNSFNYVYDYELEKHVHTIRHDLPVKPYTNVYKKMSNTQMENFYKEISDLSDNLEESYIDSDPHTACKRLTKYFGDLFPVPESTETRYQASKSHGPSSSSALDR